MKEYRAAELIDFELQGMDFRGKAAVFDQPWADALTERHGYREVVKRGAFTAALGSSSSIPLLREHDPLQLLATTHAETLKVYEDGDALMVEASLPPTPLGEETRALIDRGDLRGMSYGVESDRKDSQLHRVDGMLQRTIRTFRRMIDVSITYDPAYPATSAELRSGWLVASLDDLGITSVREYDPSGTAARIRALTIDQLEKGI